MPPGSLALLAQGAVVSLLLAAAAIVGGTALAVILVAGAFSRLAAVRAVYRLYVYVVRGTPLLVMALLVFYALPALDLRTGPYIAGTLVLIIYTGALFAEVFRGGVLAIPRPQWESARSLGLPPGAMVRKIIAPMVVRYALPPYINVCVMTVKASSILSIISVWERTYDRDPRSQEVLRRDPGAPRGGSPRGRRRGAGPRRAERVREDHPPPLHQLPRGVRRR